MFGEKAPYIVTLIVAGLAWTITHIVDRLLTTPLLTYQSQIIENGGKKSLYLTLKNVTREKTFRNVRMILTAAHGDLITDAAVIPIQPAWEGDQPGTLSGRTFDYTFLEMQPGSQFEVSLTFGGSDQPTVRLSTDGTISFVHPSWETWLVENEIYVLAWVLGVGIILLLVTTVLASRDRPRGHECHDT
jgi:hypothetical protein